jgi:hypothetical protein
MALVKSKQIAGGTGGGSATVQNVIDTPTTIPANTSILVVGTLTVNSTLTVNGNLGVI